MLASPHNAQAPAHAAETHVTMACFSVAFHAIGRGVLVRFLLPGGVGHAGLSHFLFDPGEGFFVEFFLGLLFSHVVMVSSRPKQCSSI